MFCKKALYTAVFCMLSLVTVTSCSNKPVVIATWTFVNATKAGCFVCIIQTYGVHVTCVCVCVCVCAYKIRYLIK